jgi:hypothetical protein
MASAVSQLQAARSAPRLWHSSMATIVPQECVGVYMQAMITSSDVQVTSSDVRVTSSDVQVTSSDVRVTSSDVQVTSSDVRVTSSDVRVRICISVPYGRRTELA